MQKNIVDEIWDFLYKNISLIGFILLGLIGKFSYDLLTNKKFSLTYILGCSGIALCVGWIAGGYIFSHYPDNAPFMVPAITLVGNNLISAVMSIDYKKLILERDWKGAIEILTRKKG